MQEKTIEKKLREEVRKLGGYAIKFFCQTFTGLPDRIILMPGGRIWFAEIKTTGKKPTARQHLVHEMLRKMSFSVHVVDDQPGLDSLLNEIKQTNAHT